MTRVLVVVAAVLPWCSLLPLPGTLAVLAQACAFVAAAHGAGLVVAALAGRSEAHPVLAVQWGFAGLISVAGLAIALHAYTLPLQITIVCCFMGVHSALLVLRWRTFRPVGASGWVAPAILLVGLGVIHVLGAAGDVGTRPFDDDGNVLAQIQRMRDTGWLGDPVGYARTSQLAGQLALNALATLPGDVHLVKMLEAIAFVAALSLACARMRPRGLGSSLWSLLVIITASALAFAPVDRASCWTVVGLVLALHATIADDQKPPLAIVGLVAGALVSLRLALVPVALAALIGAWWPQRRDPRAAWSSGFGIACALGPLVLARITSGARTEVRQLLALGTGLSAGKVLMFVAISLAAGGLGAVIARGRSHRWLAIGGMVAGAAVLSSLLGDRAYALRFLWPVAISAGLVIAIEVSQAVTLTSGAMVASLVAMMLIHEGREATGRTRWARRYLDLAASIEYVRHTGQHAPIAGGYAGLLERVPRGATIAIWVQRPERLDYAAHRFVDLRTPRVAPLRVHRWDAHPSRLARLVEAVGAEYLLIEDDDREIQRIHESWLERFVCSSWKPACADDLETLVLTHPVVGAEGGVRLVSLNN